MPKLTIVIGANGAGKSTWCERHRAELPTNFYNADSIARGLGDWNSAQKQREARELVDQAIEHQLAARSDFGFESTYSGRSRPSIVRRAKALGYHVSAVFVGTRGPEINVDRVKARVADRSGHDVPEIEIRRRWTAVQENLIATSDAIDSIQLIENSGSRARRVTTVARSQQTEVAPDSPRWARDLARRIAGALRMGQAAGDPKHPAMSAAIQHLSFSGALIERGFWLYVWRVTSREGREFLYVGRTGDSSSPRATAPYTRMGQHLGQNRNQNALRSHLERRGVPATDWAAFDLIAYGPIYPEIEDDGSEKDTLMQRHTYPRNNTGVMERLLCEDLRARGYDVMNNVKCRFELDADGENRWQIARTAFRKEFPPHEKPNSRPE